MKKYIMGLKCNHKKTVLGMAFAAGLAFIFPPYIIKYKGIIVDSGYGFIFALPTMGRGRVHSTVNISTLLVEILAILVVGGLIYFALSKGQERKSNE